MYLSMYTKTLCVGFKRSVDWKFTKRVTEATEGKLGAEGGKHEIKRKRGWWKWMS